MAGIRFFGGARNSTGGKHKTETASKSAAMREQIKKGGRIDPAENYKLMLKNKMKEAKYRTDTKGVVSKEGETIKRTRTATAALEKIAAMEVAKNIKAARMAVQVKPRRYLNGRIDIKGRIYDQVGNLVGTVNLKNGSIRTQWGITGKRYDAKSHATTVNIQEIIRKNSPYLKAQRRAMRAQQQLEKDNAAAADAAWREQQAKGSSGSFWGASQSGTDIWGNPNSGLLGW